MNPFVVSDVTQWSAFFDELLKAHGKLRGSMLGKEEKTKNWNMQLINTATTTTRKGREFAYFDAVDTGRSAINTRFNAIGGKGHFLIFAGLEGITFKQRVSGTIGYNITAKSQARTVTTIDTALRATFQAWLDTANEKSIKTTGVKTRKILLGKARVGQAPRDKNKGTEAAEAIDKTGDRVRRGDEQSDQIKDLTRGGGFQFEKEGKQTFQKLDEAALFLESAGLEIDAEGNLVTIDTEEGNADINIARKKRIKKTRATYDKIVDQLLDKSDRTFDEDQILYQAINAANRAGAKEGQRVALLRSAAISRASFRFRIPGIRGEAQELAENSLGKGNKEVKGLAKLLRGELLAQEILTNPALRKFVKINNWYALAGIFGHVVGDQIETSWKPNTPVRQTGKIIYVSAGQLQTIGGPGGDLRNGYKLIASPSYSKIIFESF